LILVDNAALVDTDELVWFNGDIIDCCCELEAIKYYTPIISCKGKTEKEVKN